MLTNSFFRPDQRMKGSSNGLKARRTTLPRPRARLAAMRSSPSRQAFAVARGLPEAMVKVSETGAPPIWLRTPVSRIVFVEKEVAGRKAAQRRSVRTGAEAPPTMTTVPPVRA